MSDESCAECGRALDQAGRCGRCDETRLPLGSAEATIAFPAVAAPAEADPTIVATTYSSSTDQLGHAAIPESDIARLADHAQTAALHCAWICALVLLASLLYLTRAPATPPPLPAGVATLLQAGTAATGSASPASPAATQSDATQYLTFLQTVDLQRIGMLSSFDSALAAATNPTSAAPQPPTTNFAEAAQTLVSDFLAQKAPTDCAGLSAAYFRLLQDQTAMVGKSYASLITGDSRGALAGRDLASTQIQTDAQAADIALAQLCVVQHLDKPFSIIADPANPSGAQTAPVSPAPVEEPLPAVVPPPTQQTGSTGSLVNPSQPQPSTAPAQPQPASSTTG